MQQAVPTAPRDSAYIRLVRERNRFTVAMTITFLVLYLLLPILAGYARDALSAKVMGNITLGYVLAFLEFVMGWVLAAVYVRRARQFDRLAEQARAEVRA